jgi:hypothetical protein
MPRASQSPGSWMMVLVEGRVWLILLIGKRELKVL